MPEGHSVHRIARQFAAHFVGRRVAVSSPQGRFASGAAKLDGRVMTGSRAIGKQLFLEFEGELWMRVHLGMYGAWDFAGDISTGDGAWAAVDEAAPLRGRLSALEFEDSLHSIGAPRRARLRMAEQETEGEALESWPPEPVGAVRARLLTDTTCADLRGPTACEVLGREEVRAAIAKLGPDPLVDRGRKGEDRFTETVRRKPTPIALLLMDQSVVAGIGNIYRAELLFRARLNPFIPGRDLPEETVRALWKDWAKLLRIGVKTGQMLTMDGLRGGRLQAALANRDDRHWVYHRTGRPCRVCGTPIAMQELAARKLYWCPHCQA